MRPRWSGPLGGLTRGRADESGCEPGGGHSGAGNSCPKRDEALSSRLGSTQGRCLLDCHYVPQSSSSLEMPMQRPTSCPAAECGHWSRRWPGTPSGGPPGDDANSRPPLPMPDWAAEARKGWLRGQGKQGRSTAARSPQRPSLEARAWVQGGDVSHKSDSLFSSTGPPMVLLFPLPIQLRIPFLASAEPPDGPH